MQRIDVLNHFLVNNYGKKRIIMDGVVPKEFIFTSSDYLAEYNGIVSLKGIYSHISSIDLMQTKDGT